MIEFHCNKKKYFAPFTWNEMTRRQLISFCRVITHEANRKIQSLRIAQLMTGIKWKLFLKIPVAERKENIEKHFEFFISEKPNLTENKIPKLRFGFHTYHGPQDVLKKIRAQEFFYVETFFIKYNRTKDENYLNALIAILYRPLKSKADRSEINYDGDAREKFNPHWVDGRIKKISRLKMEVKIAIYLYYLSCRSEFETRHPQMFTKEKSDEVSKLGWKALINEIAGNKFGTIEETYNAPMEEIFIECDRILAKKQ
jgi:hypothetical protein